VAKGPLVRWFNTNTFYYTPVVKDEISTDGKAIWRRIEKRFLKRDNHFKIILPDPLTFSELAEDSYYRNPEELLFAYADALGEEIRFLEKQGAAYVQLSSPSLVARFRGGRVSRDKLKQQAEAIRSALRGVSLRTCLHTYFGDASPYLPELLDAMPTDDVGFDFSQTDPGSLGRTKKGIVAGVADSRSTYLEGVEELSSAVRRVVEKTGSRSITLAPSSDLRFIPRVSADEKLRRLGALKRKLGGD
jgi:5-methyltetrahydropteroyltriglutamate--homocysteine methyltransferase